MLKSILFVIKEELKIIFTSKSIISVLLLGPIIYSFLYPQPYLPEILRDIPIAVIDQDNTPQSRQLIRDINVTDTITMAQHVSTMKEAEQLIADEKIYGILLIPFNFEKQISLGKSSPIVFYGNASYILIYNNIATTINNVISAQNSKISITKQIAQGIDPAVAKRNSLPFTPDMISLFNPQAGYATYVLPASFMLILHQVLFVSITLASVLTIRNREIQLIELTKNHTYLMSSLIVSVGRITTYVCLYMITFWFYILLLRYGYDLPYLADRPTLLAFALFFLITTTCFALAVSTFFKKIDDVFLMILPMSMILFFLSGISWPKQLIPEFLFYAAHIFPATIAMIGLTKITQMGAPFHLILSEIYNFILLAIIYLAINITHHYLVLQRLYRNKKLKK